MCLLYIILPINTISLYLHHANILIFPFPRNLSRIFSLANTPSIPHPSLAYHFAFLLSQMTTAHASKSLSFTIRSVSGDNLYIAANATYICQRLPPSSANRSPQDAPTAPIYSHQPFPSIYTPLCNQCTRKIITDKSKKSSTPIPASHHSIMPFHISTHKKGQITYPKVYCVKEKFVSLWQKTIK